MDNLDLLLKLVKAEDEEEVNKIIASHPVLSKDENWKPLAGERSNIGLAHAQQASPIPALIEKRLNSIKFRGHTPDFAFPILCDKIYCRGFFCLGYNKLNS